MNAKRVNAAAGVIHGSQVNGKQTAAGIAADLESACMLQSPESAAEFEALQARVAELEENLRAVNAGWGVARDRIAELEQAAEQIRFLHKDSPMGPCPVCINGDAGLDEDPTVPYPCPTARLAGAKDCDPPSADKLTRLLAPTQALREDEYASPLHHTYRLGRDLPQPGGAP